MPIELYANGAASTLSSGITNSQTTLSVASASSFPSGTGQFRIIVDAEIMIVTGVSGTTFTVTRGAESTVAASHLSGAAVTHDVTRDSLPRLSERNFWPGTRAIGKTKSVMKEYQSISAGATYTVCDLSGLGPGYIAAMTISPSGSTGAGREASVLKIFRDGQVTPDVSGTIGAIHGVSYGASSFNSNWMGWVPVSSYFNRFIIPFDDGFKVQMINGDGSNAITLFLNILYVLTPNKFDWGRMARFKLLVGEQSATAANSVVTLLDVPGRGAFFGLTQTFHDSNNNNLHFAEGNHKMYIDSEGSNSLEWAGTEDYYENPGYWTAGYFIGPHTGTQLKSGTTDVGSYRFHDTDPIAFDTNFKMTWNCGNTAQASMGSTLNDHIWCAYYYLDQ